MKQSDNTTFSITANIDLLGFSDHLIMSNYDLRTKIGEAAILRLKNIEDALDFVKKEIKTNPDFYPETFRFLRFNDSLILGIDINPPILPVVGRPNEGNSFTYNDVKEFYGADLSDSAVIEKARKDFDLESLKVCSFLGIVARIHNFINEKEYQTQMPGCRTIIATGLRYRFYDNQGKEDFYSANFSFSNAYIVNEKGSKGGFCGNSCFIENNVANICGLNAYTSRIMGFAKYKMSLPNKDPFDGKPNSISMQLSYTEVNIIPIEIFRKQYHFRELNTVLVANFQLLPNLIETLHIKRDKKNDLLDNILNMFKTDTPKLSEPYTIENHPHFKYPLLFFSCKLEENIKDSFDFLIKDHSA